MVGTKIARPMHRWRTNNSPKRWIDGRNENNSLNGCKNSSPKGWVERKFIGRHRDYLLDRKAVAGAS